MLEPKPHQCSRDFSRKGWFVVAGHNKEYAATWSVFWWRNVLTAIPVFYFLGYASHFKKTLTANYNDSGTLSQGIRAMEFFYFLLKQQIDSI